MGVFWYILLIIFAVLYAILGVLFMIGALHIYLWAKNGILKLLSRII